MVRRDPERKRQGEAAYKRMATSVEYRQMRVEQAQYNTPEKPDWKMIVHRIKQNRGLVKPTEDEG